LTRYGYARVSTRDQSTDQQVDALRTAGVADEHMFIEKISGKLSSRPKLDKLLEKLQAGDQVVVTRFMRIGGSHQHLARTPTCLTVVTPRSGRGILRSLHVDVKKLGRVPDGGGWRLHGRSELARGGGPIDMAATTSADNVAATRRRTTHTTPQVQQKRLRRGSVPGAPGGYSAVCALEERENCHG
jgi:hypothetical protein